MKTCKYMLSKLSLPHLKYRGRSSCLTSISVRTVISNQLVSLLFTLDGSPPSLEFDLLGAPSSNLIDSAVGVLRPVATKFEVLTSVFP